MEIWLVSLRVAIFVMCAGSVLTLLMRFKNNRDNWNAKTRDYWYALVSWSVAGMVIAVEGIRHDTPFGVRTVFVTVSAVVSLIGLRRKGDWGSTVDR